MLFIWDLHFKADKKDIIFQKLEEKILKINPDNIIFLWDYIYHFAYNPKLIWKFFDFCLNLSKEKQVFILAWNHDYIKWHFVLLEAEKVLKKIPTNLHIISNPEAFEINNKKILFLPFYNEIKSEKDFSKTDKLLKSLSWKNKNVLLDIFVTAYKLWKEDDKNLKISWSINLELINQILNYNPDIIVHHFYTANTKFPGQFSKFSYKNIALSEKVFELENIEIISWHLHQPFKYKNYICVWSFWNTSPLEENDTKVIYHYPNKFYQVVINPYITIELTEKKEITQEDILKKFNENTSKIEENLWNIEKDKFNLKNFNITIKSEKFIKPEEIFSEELLNKIWKISYRQKTKKLGNILNELDLNQEKLQHSFNSWKELAKQYIEKKYPNNKEEYFKILEELNLI